MIEEGKIISEEDKIVTSASIIVLWLIVGGTMTFSAMIFMFSSETIHQYSFLQTISGIIAVIIFVVSKELWEDSRTSTGKVSTEGYSAIKKHQTNLKIAVIAYACSMGLLLLLLL